LPTNTNPADTQVDGAFKAFAVSLPENSELMDQIPGADPTLLHEVRGWLTGKLHTQCMEMHFRDLMLAGGLLLCGCQELR
jgi:hypothetical protein